MIVTKTVVFVVVGFPANDFLWQEPGSDKGDCKFLRKELWCHISYDE